MPGAGIQNLEADAAGGFTKSYFLPEKTYFWQCGQ
jgi:hypothetical protein